MTRSEPDASSTISGGSMKQPLKACVACVVVLVPAACASRAAPDISGRWAPVNHFDSRAQEIPLYPAYEFYAAPLDRTVKTMLARWAHDSKMTLDYQPGSDFTLYEPVSRIRTTDLRQALAQLSSLYVADQLDAALVDNAIIVRRSASPARQSQAAGQDNAAPTIPPAVNAPSTLAMPPASHQ